MMGNVESRVNRYKPPAGQVDFQPTAATFQCILDNDPRLTGIQFHSDSVFVDIAGRAVSQSMHLQRLQLLCYPSINSLEILTQLLMCLAQN
jgi:hypothetical protein